MMKQGPEQDIRTYVRDRYAEIARAAADRDTAAQDTASGVALSQSCCGPGEGVDCCPPEAAKLYDLDIGGLPEEVTELSLGCGDPVALASLEPGQTVLDLGSGGGIDCFLAAEQVGPEGWVIGVDMTPAMIDRARANKEKVGVDNVEFRLGEIEHLPVPDASVDVILSNCVINLSPDKPQVFHEAYRVLKPGGRLAVSDIVTDGPLPRTIRENLSAWAGCVSGALDVQDYLAVIRGAGFVDVQIEPVALNPDMVVEVVDQHGERVKPGEAGEASLLKSIYSAKVTAYKPLD
jgi:SAM-dependent methyltransferase